MTNNYVYEEFCHVCVSSKNCFVAPEGNKYYIRFIPLIVASIKRRLAELNSHRKLCQNMQIAFPYTQRE